MDPTHRWILSLDCCACREPLKDHGSHVNTICLNRRAEWKHPSWGNILVPGSGGRASAIICDRCLKENNQPTHGIEWDTKGRWAKYHKIKDLKELPPVEVPPSPGPFQRRL